MRIIRLPMLMALLVLATAPAWADSCRNVDMYGIYKICDAPKEQAHHDDRPQAVVQPIYVNVPQTFETPVQAPAPVLEPADNDDSFHRDLTAVDAQIHALHLLLADKQTRGKIDANFYDEETRYLSEIENREQSAADVNGGYLTVAQENVFLQQLQDIEGEINNNISNNG